MKVLATYSSQVRHHAWTIALEKLMATACDEWTLPGFREHFHRINQTMPDHSFAWILGAGASIDSAIPGAASLVKRWLTELHTRECLNGKSIEEWATEENLGIRDFRYANATAHYPHIFERRFRKHADEGYACLEDLMSGRDPSPGYSI